MLSKLLQKPKINSTPKIQLVLLNSIITESKLGLLQYSDARQWKGLLMAPLLPRDVTSCHVELFTFSRQCSQHCLFIYTLILKKCPYTKSLGSIAISTGAKQIKVDQTRSLVDQLNLTSFKTIHYMFLKWIKPDQSGSNPITCRRIEFDFFQDHTLYDFKADQTWSNPIKPNHL